MILRIFFVILALPTLAQAKLPYKLPPKAKYQVSDEAIAKAKNSLTRNLSAEPTALSKLFESPLVCGPGLWDILKSSSHFSKSSLAKGTIKMPIANGRTQTMSMTILQSEAEASSFRKALADLLTTQGELSIREPNQDEFMTFWAVLPFDEISGPLLVAEGKDVAILCQFEKGRVFWIDEVKRMHIRK